MKFLALSVLIKLTCLLFFSPLSFANNSGSPFKKCGQVMKNVSYLTCQVDVVDSYIKEAFGQRALRKAQKKVNKKCNSSSKVKLSSKLGLMSALNCELKVKIKFFDDNFDKL